MKILDFFRPYPELRTVIVNLKSGRAFRGVVWRRRGPFMVLRNAELLKDRAGGNRLDGEVLVERVDIDFIQVL